MAYHFKVFRAFLRKVMGFFSSPLIKHQISNLKSQPSIFKSQISTINNPKSLSELPERLRGYQKFILFAMSAPPRSEKSAPDIPLSASFSLSTLDGISSHSWRSSLK